MPTFSSANIPSVQRCPVDARRDIVRDLVVELHQARLAKARFAYAHRRHVHGGLIYTILRPSCFVEVWPSPAVGFDIADAQAQIYGTGNQDISWISLQDVAQFAVEALESPAARYATLELGGPEALKPLQVAQIYEERVARSFEVQHIPEKVLQAQRETAVDPMEQSFAGLMLCYARGDAIDMRVPLEAFRLQLTSVDDYARRAAAPGG